MSIEQSQSAHPLEYTGPFSDEVYRDRANGWRRRFALAGECLIIQARHISGSEYRSTISFRDIDPLYSIVRSRKLSSSYYSALAIFVFIVLVVLAPFVQNKPRMSQAVMTAPVLIAAGFTLLVVLPGLVGFRRVEYYQFRSTGGRFDIARKGPDRDRFDAFIARLLARAQEARQPVRVSTKNNFDEIPLAPPSDIKPPLPSEPAKKEPPTTRETPDSTGS